MPSATTLSRQMATLLLICQAMGPHRSSQRARDVLEFGHECEEPGHVCHTIPWRAGRGRGNQHVRPAAGGTAGGIHERRGAAMVSPGRSMIAENPRTGMHSRPVSGLT